jgi:hypothetical protein
VTRRGKRRAAKKARAPVLQVSVSKIMDECVAAVSLIEVTVRSLEANDRAACEQVTMQRALKAIWIVHDYLSDVLGAGKGGEDDEDE